MSVIVKGMQMPKACMLCPIYDGEYGECCVLHNRYLFPLLSEDTYRYDTTKERHKDCPLVESPQGEWIKETPLREVCPFCKSIRTDYRHVYCGVCGAYLGGDAE